MNRLPKYVLPFAGLLALTGANCASTQKQGSESPSPTTREVANSQKLSEEALKRAQEMQKQASEQAQKAAAAQAQVRQDQEKLGQDQRVAQQEQAKAQQLQLQARQETQQAAGEVQQQQTRAASGLAQETQRTARGQQIAAGVVTQVRPDEIVVQPASGEAMRFRISDQTQVQIAGRQASADELKEGSEARVSYEASTEGPRAVLIRVTRAGATAGPQGMGTGGEGAQSPQPQNPQGTPPGGSSGAQEGSTPAPSSSGGTQ
jgi:hypothetical protein